MSTTIRPTIACIAADLIPGNLGGAESHIVQAISHLTTSYHIILFVGSNTSITSHLPTSVSVYPVYYPKIPNLHGLFYILCGLPQILFRLLHQPPQLLWAKQSYPQAPLATLLKLILHRPLYITAQNPHLHLEELVIQGSLLSRFHTTLASLLTPLITFSFHHSDTVAAVSYYSTKLAQDLGAKHVIVIPNGINQQLLRPSTSPKYNSWTIITTSSLIPRNGIDTLIQAFSLLNLPNSRLLIAGSGPLRPQLQHQVRHLHLSSKVKFLGRVPNHHIPALLSRCHVYARPSRHEGFGVSFIEAMARRIPIVATPVGGVTDFITHRRTGLLAQVDNPQSIARCLRLLYTSPRLSRQLTATAYQLVKSKYTWNHISIQIHQEFNRLITQ